MHAMVMDGDVGWLKTVDQYYCCQHGAGKYPGRVLNRSGAASSLSGLGPPGELLEVGAFVPGLSGRRGEGCTPWLVMDGWGRATSTVLVSIQAEC